MLIKDGVFFLEKVNVEALNIFEIYSDWDLVESLRCKFWYWICYIVSKEFFMYCYSVLFFILLGYYICKCNICYIIIV